MAKTLNVEKLVKQKLGGTVTGVAEDGSVKFKTFDVEAGEEIEKTFNLPKFMASQNMNPGEFDIKYNSPETAVSENAVGFGAGMKLAVAKSPEDKLKVLESEYGAENVQKFGTDFKVKQGGVWKDANTSFLSEFAADTPVAAAGIAGFAGGAKAGAAVGTAVLPGIGTAIGGALGGVLGGAVSATLARFAQIKDAEMLGIRTEADAEELKTELGREFANSVIWDTALMGTGKVVKPIAKYSKSFIKRGYDKFFDKEAIAATMEKMMPGTRQVDWGTVLKSTDDATQVLKDMDGVIKYNKKAAEGKVTRGMADPATEKMTRIVTSSMKGFKTKAMNQYDQTMSYLDNQGVFAKAKVKAEPLFDSLQNSLKELGLVDDAGTFMSKKQAFESDEIQQLFSGKSRRTLKEVYEQLGTTTRREGNLGFKEARKLISGIDDILESSGYFKGGDMAISNAARRTLKQTRADIKNSLGKSLDDKFVTALDGSGKRVKASHIFSEAQTKYSNFRNSYDDFAIQSSFGGDKRQIFNTVQRMLGENGYALEESFGRMAKSVGKDGDKVLNRLQQLRTAKNLSPIYAPAVSGKGVLITEQLIGASSPRKATQSLARHGERLAQLEQLKNAPVSKATLTGLQAMGRAAHWLNNMGPNEKVTLLSNPELYRPFMQSVFAAPEMEQQIEHQLLQGVPQE